MFENIMNFFKKLNKKEEKVATNSKSAAKERLHLVLMQDRANVSADFLELMKQEIIEVIKKYIDVDERAIDVRLTNKENEDGTNGAPALYANIPLLNIKNEARKAETEIQNQKETIQKEETEKKEESEVVKEEVTVEKEEKEEEEKETEEIAETVEEKKEEKKTAKKPVKKTEKKPTKKKATQAKAPAKKATKEKLKSKS